MADAVAAAVIMVLFITVPVWKKSKDAISEHSRERISKKKPLWEKCFIDVILLALSAYLLYNYNKQKSTLAISVLENRSIDPVMILDNSLCSGTFVRKTYRTYYSACGQAL